MGKKKRGFHIFWEKRDFSTLEFSFSTEDVENKVIFWN